MNVFSGAATRALYVTSFLVDRSLRLLEVADTEDMPPGGWSWSLASKQALDETALTLVATSARFPSSDDRRRVAAEVAAALELFEARGWLANPASYHEAPPPLEEPEIGARWLPGGTVEHLRFESGYEPRPGEPGRERWLGYGANRVAHAWVLRHAGAPRPWVVCLHPFQLSSPLFTFNLFRADWLYRRLGLNVLCPVFPLHGPRRRGWKSGEGLISGDHLNTLHGLAQAVWEVRRSLAWIRAQGAERVCLYGLSLGGCVAALLSALEPEIDCAITGIPAVDFVALERWHAPRFARWLAESAGTDWDAAARLLRVVSPLAFTPRIPWGSRYVLAGLGDRMSPPSMVRALWRHWERPRILWYAGGHLSYHFETSVQRFIQEAMDATGLLSGRERVVPLPPAMSAAEASS